MKKTQAFFLNIYHQYAWFIVGLFLFAVLGLFMRKIQGNDHFIWDFDQARDSFETQKIITNKDIILIGPQAEIYGMFHGPLTYYVLAPAYTFTSGSPWLAVWSMLLLNMLTMIPLGILSYQLFHRKALTFFALFIFAICYEQIGYARWISNLSVAVPLVTTVYLLWWPFFKEKQVHVWKSVLLGFTLGLTIQAQLFFLYLIPLIVGVFYFKRQPYKHFISFFIGGVIGVLPLIVFELKYNFQASSIFFSEFIAQKGRAGLLAGDVFLQYANHMGMTAKHTLSGFSDTLGLVLLCALVLFVYHIYRDQKKTTQLSLQFILLLLFSHAVTFVFHFVDAVFLNLGISVAMILLASFVVSQLWHTQYKQFTLFFVLLFTVLQFGLLAKYTTQHTPFGAYRFAQTGVLFSEKMQIAEQVYALSNGEPFSFGVFGNPYGVRTVWASVLQEYSRRHSATLPKWYGYHANGYPGDSILTPQDFPEQKHILLIEPTPELHSPYILQQYFDDMNAKTKLVEERELYGYKIQLREPIE